MSVTSKEAGPGSGSGSGSSQLMQSTQQLQAYVAWVNSQLKKKSGTPLIKDLRHDMQDGMALCTLIEIVAGEKIAGVNQNPGNIQDMKDNVDRVLQFMTAKRIKMHHITSKDVVEGNLKAIMRLILALAAHFKPDSVKQQQEQQQYRSRGNMAGIAQGASAALAEARRDVSCMGQRVRRPQEIQRSGEMSPRYYSSSDQYSGDSDSSAGSRARRQLSVIERRHIEGASSDGSSRVIRQSPLIRSNHVLTKSASADVVGGPQKANSEDEKEDRKTAAAIEELLRERNVLNDQMIETKKMLLQLQDLLLSGQPPDGCESEEHPLEGSNAQEKMVVLKGRLQQTTELCNDLRTEMSKSKNECMQLQGTKAGLQQRLTEQENAYLQMKAELLRIGFAKQNLEAEKDTLQKRLDDKERMIHDAKKEISHKEKMLDHIKRDYAIQFDQKDSTAKGLRAQIIDLNQKLRLVGETEASLTARVAHQDKRMARLEGKIIQSQNYTDPPTTPNSQNNPLSPANGSTDEVQVIRDSLRSVRSSFKGTDPQHHTIDTLEQSISALMEKLYLSEQQTRQSDGSDSSIKSTPNTSASTTQQIKRLNYDSTGDKRRSPITALQGFPIQRLDTNTNEEGQSTKVLYFTNQTVTPFMKTIPKKLGEITLRDFKSLFDRPGSYRYHFKALDPEFGTVKEEVIHESDLIPGWEGKIVAWIEEDQG